MIVLGIESSCDETGIAIVRDGREILVSLVSSQIELHRPYGGVVPEIASRTHLDTIQPLLDQAIKKAGLSLAQIDAIAVTNRPGLIGSLLVGVSTAKALAFYLGKPLVGVHHVEAHLYSAAMENPSLEYPFVCLIVSGGHSTIYSAQSPGIQRVLGETQDDAAGEAFDKVAAILGLPYPGGPAIEKDAKSGDAREIAFKIPRVSGNPLDFSFSGLKTAALYQVRGQDGKRSKSPVDLPAQKRANIAAAFQETVVESLVSNTIEAARLSGARQIGVGGGVACNQRLRDRMNEEATRHGMEAFFPSKHLCLDNGAMIAGLGYHLLQSGVRHSLDLDASAR